MFDNNIFFNNIFFIFYDNYLIDFCNLYNPYLFNFLYLNKYNFFYSFFYNFFYNIILIILIFYPIYNYIQLLINIKYLLNKYFNLLPFIIKDLIDRLYINIYYIFIFYKKYKYTSLLVRLLEVYKEKERYKYRRIYFSWQFLDFIFLRIILNYFYGLFFRLFYFLILFFFKLFYFIMKKIFIKFLINFKLFIFVQYLKYKLKIYILFLGYTFFLKIYTIIKYIKLEFFIYFIDENNFFGGLILYIYNSICYFISKFNNYYVWEFNGLSIKYPKYLIDNYKYSSFFNKYNFYFRYLFYFFSYIYIIFKVIILKLYNIYFILFYYIKIYIIYIYNIIWYFILKIVNLIKNLEKFFIFIGFSWFFFFEIFIRILLYILKCLLNLLINLKYLILIYLFYKLGIIYILFSYICFILKNFEFDFYMILFDLLEIFYDCVEVLNIESLYDYKWNKFLINYWYLNYNISVHNRLLYYNNTIFSKIIDFLSFDFRFLSKLYEKKSLILKDPYTIRRRIHFFFEKFYNLLINEISLFYLIFKDYFLFKYFSIYYMYIYVFSNLNLYYYCFKKIILFIYLLFIYIYCYFKFLYFYFLPNHINSIIIKIYYFFCKFWWLIYLFKFIYLFFYYNFINIYNIYLYCYLSKYSYFIFIYFWLLSKYLYSYLLFYYLNIIDFLNNFYFSFSFWYYTSCEFYLYSILNKKLKIINLKEFLINYFRLDINNLLGFRFNNFSILGNKVKGMLTYDLDALDLAKVLKYKISLKDAAKRDSSLLVKAPYYCHYQDNFVFYNKFYILNNFYYIYNFYSEKLINYNNLFDINFYILNFYVKDLIFFNNYSFVYIFYYFIIYYIYIYIFNFKKYKDNINIDTMWFRLRKNFNYKVLKNDKLFIEALNLYQKKTGKKKILNMFNTILDNFWNVSKYNRINYKNLILKINKINIGDLSSHIFNKKLNNYIIEKNMYYNNQKFFYWKNFIFFGKNIDYYLNNDDTTNILYFFLSLTFRKNIYSSRIYYYLDNFNKYYFHNNIYSKFITKINESIINYFISLNNLFYFKKKIWLLNNDISLLIYKNEFNDLGNNYSLNSNKTIPNFIFEFYWVGFFIYLFVFKLYFWYLNYLNIYHARIAVIYFYTMLLNNNFLYLYDINNYWFNNFFMFDTKNIGYECYDYKIFNAKLRKFLPKPKGSTLFIINNDPLFLYNKNYIHHLRHYNFNYINFYSTFNILLKNIFINFINLILFIFVVIRNKYIIIKFIKYNYTNLVNIFINYKKNIIKLNNYLFLKQKILS